MYLLDSNVISELRSPRRCAAAVKAWQGTVALESCFTSVVVLAEIREGIERVRGRDPQFADALDRWLEDRVKPMFGTKCLAITADIAELAGRIGALRTRGFADCLIAATALPHRLTLVTRNIGDFDDIEGLILINPWLHGS